MKYIKRFENIEYQNFWQDIDNSYEDEDTHDIYIDAWLIDEFGDEVGSTIATVNILTSEVKYRDERAKTNKKAQEIIQDTLDNIVPVRKLEIEAEKYNL